MKKIAFKTIFLPYLIQGDEVIISNNEKTFRLNNVDSKLTKIINTMDGTKSYNDILEVNDVSSSFLNSFIDFLNNNFFIEYLDSEEVKNFSDSSRYKSNLLYYSNFSNKKYSSSDIHNEIRKKTVLLLGLGGASIIAATLTGMGIKRIIGVDYDVIDKSNLSRQFLFSEENIGESKTTVTKNFLSKINSDVDVYTYNRKITCVADIEQILKENQVDIIVNGLDSPSVVTSRWVNNACKEYRIPMIQAGVNKTNLLLEMFVPNGACFDCVVKNNAKNNKDYVSQLLSVYGKSSSLQNVSYAPYINMLAGCVTHYIFNYFFDPKNINSSFCQIIDSRNISR